MNVYLGEVLAVARLDFAEALRSRWIIFSVVLYGVLGVTFVFVGMRESTVIGFSGMGRVLLAMIHTLLFLLPLLGLTATAQTINRSREDGTLELLFTQPVRRSAYFLAISLTRYLVLTLPLLMLMTIMGVVATAVLGENMSWQFLVQAMAISASLIAAYVGLGIAISTLVKSQTRAVIWTLGVLALGALFLDFGLLAVMLRWQLSPAVVFLLAAVNPIQAARMALLVGASSELSVLGPIGFYLAHRVGAAGLFALGVSWPLIVGGAAWLAARSAFERMDIV
ncbi:MAG: ABC transporter permease subunit [Deltaproteobacteria bacterium]|nr:ABC transporter permease subunit [Deltaproteobacteria bacterium]